jgi:hypothetical protein
LQKRWEFQDIVAIQIPSRMEFFMANLLVADMLECKCKIDCLRRYRDDDNDSRIIEQSQLTHRMKSDKNDLKLNGEIKGLK